MEDFLWSNLVKTSSLAGRSEGGHGATQIPLPSCSCKSLPLPIRTAEQPFSLHGESFHKYIPFPLKFAVDHRIALDPSVVLIVGTSFARKRY